MEEYEQDHSEPVTEEEVGCLVANLHATGMTELTTFIDGEESEQLPNTASKSDFQ